MRKRTQAVFNEHSVFACASTLVRRGEYRAQTGIWRVLGFVSARTIKGRSIDHDSTHAVLPLGQVKRSVFGMHSRKVNVSYQTLGPRGPCATHKTKFRTISMRKKKPFRGNDLFTTMFTSQMGKLQCGIHTSRRRVVTFY
jgi:hypothetical protein